MNWATDQPKLGDTILHCGHLIKRGLFWRSKTFHWWHNVPAAPFDRPDGTSGSAEWFALCEKCLAMMGGDADRVEIRGDATWTDESNDPFLRARQ